MTAPLDAAPRAEAGIARERGLSAYAKELAADRDRFRRLYADLVLEHEGLLGRAAELEAALHAAIDAGHKALLDATRLRAVLAELVELRHERTMAGFDGWASNLLAWAVALFDPALRRRRAEYRRRKPAAWAAAFAAVDGETTT